MILIFRTQHKKKNQPPHGLQCSSLSLECTVSLWSVGIPTVAVYRCFRETRIQLGGVLHISTNSKARINLSSPHFNSQSASQCLSPGLAYSTACLLKHWRIWVAPIWNKTLWITFPSCMHIKGHQWVSIIYSRKDGGHFIMIENKDNLSRCKRSVNKIVGIWGINFFLYVEWFLPNGLIYPPEFQPEVFALSKRWGPSPRQCVSASLSAFSWQHHLSWGFHWRSVQLLGGLGQLAEFQTSPYLGLLEVNR